MIRLPSGCESGYPRLTRRKEVTCSPASSETPRRTILSDTYHGDHTAGADTVRHAHPAVVVGVLPAAQEVLVAHVVGTLVQHEAAALHPAGVAAAEVGAEVGAVAHALIMPTSKIPILVEDDLQV